MLGPSFVYVRYRCGRCKRVGEKLIQEDVWDPAVLRPSPKWTGERDLRQFDHMGEITPDEVIDFHYSLEKLSADPEEEAQQL